MTSRPVGRGARGAAVRPPAPEGPSKTAARITVAANAARWYYEYDDRRRSDDSGCAAVNRRSAQVNRSSGAPPGRLIALRTYPSLNMRSNYTTVHDFGLHLYTIASSVLLLHAVYYIYYIIITVRVVVATRICTDCSVILICALVRSLHHEVERRASVRLRYCNLSLRLAGRRVARCHSGRHDARNGVYEPHTTRLRQTFISTSPQADVCDSGQARSGSSDTMAPSLRDCQPSPYISMDRWTQRFTCRLYDFFSSSSREKCNVAACHQWSRGVRRRWGSSRVAARRARAAGGPPRR